MTCILKKTHKLDRWNQFEMLINSELISIDPNVFEVIEEQQEPHGTNRTAAIITQT